MASNPGYRRLASVVDIQLEGARGMSTVEIDLRDGRTLRSPDIRLARGHPDNPLTNDEIANVFRGCLDRAPNARSVVRAYDLADRLLNDPDIPSVDELVSALRPQG